MKDVSILIPCYSRPNFLQLCLMNIKAQDYDHNHLVVMFEECRSELPFIENIDMVKQHLYPIKVIHNITDNRRTIGEKRNTLIRKCQTDYFMFFDTDDLYLPSAVSHSITLLRNSPNAGIVGSDKMGFVFPLKNFLTTAINCGDNFHMIHEPTICSTKTFFKGKGLKFKRTSTGECEGMFSGLTREDVVISDVRNVMLCICHPENTIDKDMFSDTKRKIDIKIDPYLKEIILHSIRLKDNKV